MFLSASSQMAVIRGHWVLMMFLVLMNRNCLCFLLGGSSVFAFSSYGFGHASLKCLFRGCVSALVHTTTHICWRSCYCLLPLPLPSVTLMMCLCVCLHQGYNWFLSIIAALCFSKNVSVWTMIKAFMKWFQPNVSSLFCVCVRVCVWGGGGGVGGCLGVYLVNVTACFMCVFLSFCVDWRHFIVAHVAGLVKLFSRKFIIIVVCLVTGAWLSVLITKICSMSAGQTMSQWLCF